MKYDLQIKKTLAALKDFQSATVTYTVDAINKGQRRFLIADEVGLGKTIIAKGIIASLYREEYCGDRDFSVVYICSNQALARQNLAKLNIFDDDNGASIDYNENDDRLTSLAYAPDQKVTERGFRIKALTPATSFDNRTRAGKADERILLYRLLVSITGLKTRKTAMRWFLRGGRRIGETKWNDRAEAALRFENKPHHGSPIRLIRPELYAAFETFIASPLPARLQQAVFGSLRGEETYLSALQHILPENKQHRSYTGGGDIVFHKHYYFIAELRLGLAHLCKDYLAADLYILDEFQRFSQLIGSKKTANEGEEIARAIFSNPQSRTLLLSATPFKAYTTRLDQMHGEDHYSEFKAVLQFLKDREGPAFWEGLEKDNKAFFRALQMFPRRDPQDGALMDLKNKIEKVYRGCIVRTERILVEGLEEKKHGQALQVLSVFKNDVEDYLAIHKIINECNIHSGSKLSNAVEYVKSAPFPLSFLQDYEHYKAILKAYPGSEAIAKAIKASNKAFVPTKRIHSYLPLLDSSVNEPNPKLRMLYDLTVRNGGFELLWIPPSLPYYRANSAFRKNADFSKTLIFSSWKMVPKMVSSLVSYEAERLSVGTYIREKKLTNKHKYTETDKKRRFPFPLLTFKESSKGYSGMNALLLSYPSPYLASLYDPASNLIKNQSLPQIKKMLVKKIMADLLKSGAMGLGSKNGDTQKWSWYAAIHLDKDKVRGEGTQKDWERIPAEVVDDADRENKSARLKVYEQLYSSFSQLPDLGMLNHESLSRHAEFLCNLCLGGPATTALRSLRKAYPHASCFEHRQAAHIIGEGFISMFNKPESIAVVKTSGHDNVYYRNVLDYAIGGNIQAMLDELIPQLSESSAMASPFEAAQLIRDILTVSSGKVEIVTQDSFKDKSNFAVRTHYAVPFGTGGSSNLVAGKRQVRVREAFNSPFRPFVLTSTSIGQEGLDFHLYCNNIIHWNLPSNPIDLEQREGRIKRYKGHYIRKSVASSYKSRLRQSDLLGDLWKALFEHAHRDNKADGQHCDLVPYWHPKDESRTINVTIPIYPFSRDLEKYNYIIKVLAGYRLTFGQPRQEELIEVLSRLPSDQREELRRALINLSPITYKTS